MLLAADVSIVILPLKTLSVCLLPGGSVLFISTITIKCSFQAWKCPRIFLPFIKYQEFRISFACLLLESKNVKFLILETLSCYVEVKILISVDRARGDQQQQQRAASSARWREGDNTGGRRAADTGTWAYIVRIASCKIYHHLGTICLLFFSTDI